MARLVRLVLAGAILAMLLAGASWAAAYHTVANVLGSPPPQMGTQTTSFLWEGLSSQRGHPRAWRFAYGPTHIPGAPTVRIYVSPTGRLLLTEPGDLPAKVQKLHPF